jgi:hypothetical protein
MEEGIHVTLIGVHTPPVAGSSTFNNQCKWDSEPQKLGDLASFYSNLYFYVFMSILYNLYFAGSVFGWLVEKMKTRHYPSSPRVQEAVVIHVRRTDGGDGGGGARPAATWLLLAAILATTLLATS